ncbi:MAG: Lrp/AsnC family transcriptional regulator [Chloroflexota bacterium]
MLDKIDRQIISLLQDNHRLSNVALAEKIGLTASTTHERVKKLEKKGIIEGYVARVNPVALGKPILAFIRLVVGSTSNFSQSKQSIADVCLAEPDVLECHALASEDDYILKVRAANTMELEQLIERIRSRAQISNSVTSIVLSSFKETLKLEPASDV